MTVRLSWRLETPGYFRVPAALDLTGLHASKNIFKFEMLGFQ